MKGVKCKVFTWIRLLSNLPISKRSAKNHIEFTLVHFKSLLFLKRIAYFKN